MNTVRQCSYNQYIEWYIQREVQKGFYNKSPLRLIKRLILSQKRDQINKLRYSRKLMQDDHAEGKLKHWFENADWSIVCITQDEFERSMILEGEWTKAHDLVDPLSDEANYRLLGTVAHTAIRTNYLEIEADKRMKEYYRKFKSGSSFMGHEPIVLRSLEPDEETPRNPDALFYLHDGLGRSLPYQILLVQGRLSYEPVEAFLARRRD